MKDSLIIGLTGGIASGKTTVGKIFSNLSIQIIDTDKISHDLIKKNTPAYIEIIKYFGEELIDKDDEIDRKKLSSIVFSNKKDKEKLESIIHPKVFIAIQDEIKSVDGNYKIIEVPLLIETGFYKYTDRVIVVDCCSSTQIERLIKRDNISKENAMKILSNQIDRVERLKFANEIVINEKDTDMKNLEKQVEKIHFSYLDLIRVYKK